MNNKIQYHPHLKVMIDMDGVLANFAKSFTKHYHITEYPQSLPGFFKNLDPIENAIDSFNWLNARFDVYILTSPSYKNPLCYTEKREWVEQHLGLDVCQKLIICRQKNLINGDFLIDDYDWDFPGHHIKFGSNEYPDWKSVLKYFETIFYNKNIQQ